MTQALGLTIAGVQQLVQSQLIKVLPKRSIGQVNGKPFTAQVTLEEEHTDELMLTEHPVETGAKIADHAYMQPMELVIKCGWSDSPSNNGLVQGLVGAVTGTVAGVNAIVDREPVSSSKDAYEQLRALQRQFILMDVVTGKRKYVNMMIRSIKVTTNRETENSVIATIALREVLVVSTQVGSLQTPATDMKFRGDTCPSVNQGTKQLVPAENVNNAAFARSLNLLTFP